MDRTTRTASIVAAVALWSLWTVSVANAVVLTFEGLADQEPVNNFYNGGFGGSGSGPGPAYGVIFSSNSLALIDSDAGGSGNFANEPSPSTIVFFLSGGADTMNVPAGFTTGFSFFYTSSEAAFVNVYDGLNATGNLLASIPLAANWTNNGCTGDPTGDFCNWDPIGVAFSGTAMSVDFGGTANQVGFDNITLGSALPGTVPEPGSAALLASGIAVLGMLRRRRSVDR